MLETYPDDNYLEYEAALYIWGGEEDDSTLVTPMYVGEF